jgi:double-stranded uracil-DNA glycosylase
VNDKKSFSAVISRETRIVILGSLPSDVSLRHRQYYAHPANQFWPLIGRVIEADLVSVPYENRLATLLKSGIGLWDVVACATRAGSGDGVIRIKKENQLAELTQKLPNLKLFAFNGQKAAQIGNGQLANMPPVPAMSLPSSSAAYCRISFDAKLSAWLKLREYL